MNDEAMALFGRLEKSRKSIPVSGAITLRLRDSVARTPPLEVTVLCDKKGFHVADKPPTAEPDATLEIGWQDLQRLFRGEESVPDLGMTRRAMVHGNPALILAFCQAATDIEAGAGNNRLDDQLRPFPGVEIHRPFATRPFQPSDPLSLPIVINAFNRLSCLRQLVDFLHGHGYSNLYVIDNASDYPPLLEYYAQSGLSVFRLNRNVGCYSLWRTAVEKDFLASPYAFTDPDVVPVEECPGDFVAHFLRVLENQSSAAKVGFGLKIDDIPAHIPHRQEIISHETKFWGRSMGKELYAAPIDTTFAVYRPGARGGAWIPGIRTGGDYVARHLTWYADPTRPSEEEQYYWNTACKATHWTAKFASYPFTVAR